MLRRVALVRTDVSEELSASIIRVTSSPRLLFTKYAILNFMEIALFLYAL
jgi:hypothetical protein